MVALTALAKANTTFDAMAQNGTRCIYDDLYDLNDIYILNVLSKIRCLACSMIRSSFFLLRNKNVQKRVRTSVGNPNVLTRTSASRTTTIFFFGLVSKAAACGSCKSMVSFLT
ncbi:hypothetical protein BLOT_011558 [Blomia tropicalis]|nr:hypothetical protein BLOT_011558 [Blomia tropicalis]